jgi:hypothetical protein
VQRKRNLKSNDAKRSNQASRGSNPRDSQNNRADPHLDNRTASSEKPHFSILQLENHGHAPQSVFQGGVLVFAGRLAAAGHGLLPSATMNDPLDECWSKTKSQRHGTGRIYEISLAY